MWYPKPSTENLRIVINPGEQVSLESALPEGALRTGYILSDPLQSLEQDPATSCRPAGCGISLASSFSSHELTESCKSLFPPSHLCSSPSCGWGAQVDTSCTHWCRFLQQMSQMTSKQGNSCADPLTNTLGIKVLDTCCTKHLFKQWFLVPSFSSCK